MTTSSPLRMACVLILSAVSVAWTPETGFAQSMGDRGDRGDRGERGRGGPGGWGGRGGGRWGGGGDGDSQEEYRDQDRREWWLRRMDRNGNGVLEEGEVDGRARGFVEGLAKQAGVAGKKEFRLSELMPGRFEQSTETAMGFGEAGDTAVAPGFGDEVGATSDSSRFIPSTEEEREGAERTADDLVRRYDSNRNRQLEREEWTKISGSPANSDTNRDGIITKTELVNRLIVMRRTRAQEDGRGGPESRDQRDGPRRDRDARREQDSPRSYRFVTALERIPVGARSWITSKDKDGDGQVSMAEYSSSWSDSRVRDFDRYDGNGDGVITPDEYLANK